jgi:Ser/Thr protein kinase RdoA (MazF antagonist)
LPTIFLDEAIRESGLEPHRQIAFRRALERTAEVATPLYASLPQQVTHGDFAFANTLMRDGR